MSHQIDFLINWSNSSLADTASISISAYTDVDLTENLGKNIDLTENYLVYVPTGFDYIFDCDLYKDGELIISYTDLYYQSNNTVYARVDGTEPFSALAFPSTTLTSTNDRIESSGIISYDEFISENDLALVTVSQS